MWLHYYTILLYKRPTGKQASSCHMFLSLLKWHKASVTLTRDFNSEMDFCSGDLKKFTNPYTLKSRDKRSGDHGGRGIEASRPIQTGTSSLK